jgi:competence protein ComEC
MAGWFASCPLATLEVYTPTPPMYLAYYAGVAAALTAAAGRRRAVRVAGGAVTGGCAALLGVLTLVRLGGAGDVDGARLTMLDVGQGQAVFVEARGGRRALVDVGSLGGLDVGKHVVAPFHRHEWIGRLDLLVLTHAETDHMSGAPSILRSFEVGEVWSPSPLGPSPTGLWIEEYLRHRRIPHRIVRADMVPAALGEARLEVLFPPSGLPAAGREPQSLVLAVAAAGHTALLTADITARQGEGDLVQRGVTAEVLTVPHHGGARVRRPPEPLPAPAPRGAQPLRRTGGPGAADRSARCHRGGHGPARGPRVGAAGGVKSKDRGRG